MTNGGRDGTSGGAAEPWRLPPWLPFAIVGGFGLVEASVTALSVIDDHAELGRPLEPWRPWAWELTSVVGWLAMLPFIMLAVARIRPPRFGWPATIALHLAFTVPVSLGHVGVMTGLRHLIYAAQGLVYRLRAELPADLLYEYRKDAPDYLLIAATLVILERLLRPPTEPPVAPAAPVRIEVRDGSRTVWLAPADILWAEAAGNYVELHTAAGALLHRTSLAALERELAPHGFARIHRSRLVRRDAVRAVETNASGDFEAVLTNGAQVGGSRRYRAALDA